MQLNKEKKQKKCSALDRELLMYVLYLRERERGVNR